MKQINEVAKLAKTTVRTLQYYDKIGLLKPSEITATGYRLYDDRDIERLWQIMFFKELDFSLKEIKELMSNPEYDKIEALTRQRELLIQKRNRMNKLIELIQDTLKGDNEMSLNKISFDEFDMSKIEENKRKYKEEVIRRWGKTKAYGEYEVKTDKYKESDWKAAGDEHGNILRAFGEHRQLAASDCLVQELVKRWQDYITDNFYECTKEILSGLGVMYTEDERFRNNIDKYGEGTAKLMSEAIEIYCSKED